MKLIDISIVNIDKASSEDYSALSVVLGDGMVYYRSVLKSVINAFSDPNNFTMDFYEEN
jgi:hypothetical protein